jgi:putative acetyltransferase
MSQTEADAAGVSRPDVHVRPETEGDRAAVRRINVLAFGGPAEADLVEALHRDGAVLSSLVAEVGSVPVGHVLFSRMWVDTAAGPFDAVCLAPASVLESWQRRGVGTVLIERGLEEMRRRGERLVLVVGHPAYYPRFGFHAAQPHGLTSPFSPEAFMALELVPGALQGVAGPVRYPAAFGL